MTVITAPIRTERRDDARRDLVVGLEPGFDFRSKDYSALFEASGADAFRHPIWLDAFYRLLAPARGAKPVVVVGREGAGGRPSFVLPLILRRKFGLRLLETADLGVSDYAAPVMRADWRDRLAADPKVAPAVRSALPPHDLMRIQPIRSDALAEWRMFLGGQALTLGFSAHAADMKPPYQAWRAGHMSASFRKYLDRRKNRFLKGGGVLRIVAPEAAAQAIGAIRDLRTGRFDGDVIQDRATSEFYARVAAEGAKAGLSRIYCLSLRDTPVGYVFALTHAGRLYYLLIGCDYAAYGRHSPGLVMYDLMMEQWVAEGGQIFDFTIGDEAFKADFGTTATAMQALVATPTLAGKAGLAIFDARGRVRRMAAGLRGRVLGGGGDT